LKLVIMYDYVTRNHTWGGIWKRFFSTFFYITSCTVCEK
jgi:hypothetical protein